MAYRTPRKQFNSYRSSAPRTPRSGGGNDGRPNGLFQNGSWLCNCEPRLPALCLQVRKETENKGKWFYTCQKEREKQCGFFLWKDKAEAREKGAVLKNGGAGELDLSSSIGPKAPPLPTSPPKSTQPFYRQRHIFSVMPELQRPLASTATTGQRSERHVRFRSEDEKGGLFVEQATPSAKRKRIKMEDEDVAIEQVREADEYSDLDLGSDGERELAQLADVMSTQTTQGTSNSSGASQTLAPATPAIQRMRDATGGLPTPVSQNTLLISAEKRERGAKRLKAADGRPLSPPDPFGSQSSTQSPEVTFAELATPTPVRLREGTVGSNGSVVDDYDLAETVLCLLKGQGVDMPVQNAIRDYLNRESLKRVGIERGRDIARTALQKKDARMAELQEKVTALENERKATRERLRRMGADFRAISESVAPE